MLRNADFSQDLQNWNLNVAEKRAATVEKASGATFPRSLVLETTQTTKPFASLQQPINAAFRQGEKITLKLWLKGSMGAAVTGNVGIAEQTQPRVVQAPFILSAQWQEFSAAGTCPRDFKAEELIFNLTFPAGFNTIRVGAIRLFKGEESDVAIISSPAVQPAPKPQPTFQIVGPANPHLPPSGDSSFESSPSAPSISTSSPLEVPLAKPEKPALKPPLVEPTKPAPLPTNLPVAPIQNPVAKPPLLNLPTAPRPGTADYSSRPSPFPPGMKPISPLENWLGEIMPADACGLLHDSDFAHNKVSGVEMKGIKLIGGWQVPMTPSLQSEIVAAQAGPYTNALHLKVSPSPDENAQPYSLRILQVMNTPPLMSDQLVLRVWLRSPDKACLGITLDQHSPCRPAIRETIDLTPNWKEYTFRGHPAPGPTLDSVWMQFVLGNCPGTIEITGVCLTAEGATSVR